MVLRLSPSVHFGKGLPPYAASIEMMAIKRPRATTNNADPFHQTQSLLTRRASGPSDMELLAPLEISRAAVFAFGRA
jgi:hypothetical protein